MNLSISYVVKAWLHHDLDEFIDGSQELLMALYMEELGQVDLPRLEETLPTKFLGLHVNHTAATDSGWRSNK
jgi:hypothetical protein